MVLSVAVRTLHKEACSKRQLQVEKASSLQEHESWYSIELERIKHAGNTQPLHLQALKLHEHTPLDRKLACEAKRCQGPANVTRQVDISTDTCTQIHTDPPKSRCSSQGSMRG
jgi:hypothetical protein